MQPMVKFYSKYISIILLILLPYLAFSQSTNTVATKENPKANRSAFIGISTGFDMSNYTDFATSPLRYHGAVSYFGASFSRVNKFRETEIRLSGTMGSYGVSVGEESTSSASYFINVYYSRLFRLNKISGSKWNYKAGGSYKYSGDLRLNSSLGNNALGFEMFSTLFGSFKITRDIGRTETKDKKFLWIKRKAPPRKIFLSYHFNLGLINSTYRNGKSYTGQDQIINNNTIFSNYQFKFINGYRLSSELDYTHYLKNKNALQFSYIWDAAMTGGDLDKYQVAHHTLKITFLFNTNNK